MPLNKAPRMRMGLSKMTAPFFMRKGIAIYKTKYTKSEN